MFRSLPIPPSLLLAPGEIAACGVKELSSAQTLALMMTAHTGRLIGSRRGWGTTARSFEIQNITVSTLQRRGLLKVAAGRPARARLTQRGKWYARTLCSAAAASTVSSQQGVEACLTEN